MNDKPTIKHEFEGQTVTAVVCEHRLSILECDQCDIFGDGFTYEDVSSWRDRVMHPVGWLRLRLWIIKRKLGL